MWPYYRADTQHCQTKHGLFRMISSGKQPPLINKINKHVHSKPISDITRDIISGGRLNATA
jgi:hypothetical protein